ncbi:MAG TPA: hypothetical protein VFK69_09075 [Candidatus Eisenbacteria bacterium]|nr:hypothetical protein [Candidatus Eisenbacteria bacterium]
MRMRISIVPVLAMWVALALCALPVAARAADPRFRLSAAGGLPAPGAGQAVVVLVREQFVRQTPMKPERVFVESTPLGWLPQAGYVVARVAAGVHTFWGPLNCPPLTFRARAGSTWLVRLRESIDQNDALHSHWLFDDPGNFAGLADELELREARVTARGVRELSERADQAPAPAAPDTRTQFDGIVSQLTPAHPRERYAGVLTLEPDSLRYAVDVPVTQGSSERVFMSLSIPWQNVRRVHFGGSASSDTLPWLAVDYDERGQRRTATFAHANPADAFDAYDAMFLAIDRVRRRER